MCLKLKLLALVYNYRYLTKENDRVVFKQMTNIPVCTFRIAYFFSASQNYLGHTSAISDYSLVINMLAVNVFFIVYLHSSATMCVYIKPRTNADEHGYI